MIASASSRVSDIPTLSRARALVVPSLLIVLGLVLALIAVPVRLLARLAVLAVRPVSGLLRSAARATVGRVFVVTFADGCAWRAVYVFRKVRHGAETIQHKVFHLGIDPTASRPHIFGGVGHDGRRAGMYATPLAIGYVNFRLQLPLIQWPMLMASGYNRFVMWGYRRQQAVLARIYGGRRG